jgi:hypothetical protein
VDRKSKSISRSGEQYADRADSAIRDTDPQDSLIGADALAGPIYRE